MPPPIQSVSPADTLVHVMFVIAHALFQFAPEFEPALVGLINQFAADAEYDNKENKIIQRIGFASFLPNTV